MKNKSYCELTALYWAWKNIKKIYPDLEYIGLNHYRRYFSFGRKSHLDYDIVLPEIEVVNYKLNKIKLEKYLLKYDALVAKQAIGPYSLETNYSIAHNSEDLRIAKKIIHEKYPEYDRDVYEVITCGFKFSPANMMIMKWSDFDVYCSWLFDILFQCEKDIHIEYYNPIQKRVFGYIAERLFNVWIHHNLMNVKKQTVVMFSERKSSDLRMVLSFFKALILVFIIKFGNKKYLQKDYEKKIKNK